MARSSGKNPSRRRFLDFHLQRRRQKPKNQGNEGNKVPCFGRSRDPSLLPHHPQFHVHILPLLRPALFQSCSLSHCKSRETGLIAHQAGSSSWLELVCTYKGGGLFRAKGGASDVIIGPVVSESGPPSLEGSLEGASLYLPRASAFVVSAWPLGVGRCSGTCLIFWGQAYL